MINAKTWNPAQIDQAIRRLEGIIRSGSYNPAELNQLLNQLGEPGYINTWNPAELDQKLRTLLHDLLTWKTATGNPIQLRTNNGGLVQSCEVTFSPIQSGSGEPSPTNIRPISGRDILSLYRTGVNLANTTIYKQGYLLGSDGSEIVNANYCITDKCIVTSGKDYILRFKENTGTLSDDSIRIGFYKQDGTFIIRSVRTNATTYFTAPRDTAYCVLSYNNTPSSDNYKWDIMLNEGQTELDYVPYQGQTHTATFPETVYGGKWLPIEGKAVIDTVCNAVNPNLLLKVSGSDIYYYTENDMKSGNALNGICDTFKTVNSSSIYGVRFGGNDNKIYFYKLSENITSITDLASAKQWFTDNTVYVCYPLATPTEITLTPEDIELLTGANVLWTDGDSIEITYKKLLLPSDVEELSKNKKIEEKPKTKRSKKKKEE